MTAIVGMGATPGITNLLAKYGSEKLDKVEEVGTYWVWTALDPTMGPAIIEHYFHAITGMVKTFKNGELQEIKALSEPELFEFPEPIGAWELAHAGHPEPITIPRYIKTGNVYNKGGIWPAELNEIAKLFSQFGFTSNEVIKISGVEFKAIDLAVAITAFKLLNKELKKGVYPPEAGIVDVKEVLSDVKKKFKIECSETRSYAL